MKSTRHAVLVLALVAAPQLAWPMAAAPREPLPFRFDFGPGPVAEGYTQVLASTGAVPATVSIWARPCRASIAAAATRCAATCA
jgi:hypothetical protein